MELSKPWTRQIGTSSSDDGYAIAVDGSSNVFITGATRGALDGKMSAGSEDIFVAKYDASGERLWTRQLGTREHDVGDGISVDGSGNIYIGGRTGEALDGNSNAGGGSDIFVSMFSASGDKIWTQQLGTNQWDAGEGVSADSSGNVYITGATQGSLNGNHSVGSSDIFVARICSR